MGYYDDQRRIGAQQNRQADARAAAENQARRTASHNSFVQSQQRIGEQLRQRNAAMFNDRPVTPRVQGAYRDVAARAKGKSKGGGLLFAVVIVIGIIALADQSPSTSTNPTPRAVQSVPPLMAGTVNVPSGNWRVNEAPPLSPLGHLLIDHGGVIVAEADPNAAAPTVVSSNRAAAKRPLIVTVGVRPDGSISTVTPDTGDPLLVPAAITAARQYTFKPYPYEAGKPVHTYSILFRVTPPAAGNKP